MPSDLYYKRISRWLLIIIIVTAVAVGAAGYYAYIQLWQAAEQEVRGQLLRVADLKLHELEVWADERSADARVLASDAPLLEDLRAVVQGHASPGNKQSVVRWMEGVCLNAHYANAFLLDREAHIVLQTGTAFGDAAHFKGLVEQAVKARTGVLRDLHADAQNGTFHLGLNIPLRLESGQAPFGVLCLGIDPGEYIFPMLDRALEPVRAGETVLVRREGDEALYLNKLQEKGGARELAHVPLNRREFISVKAVLGARGLVEGLNQWGLPSVGVVRAVPGSEWLLVSSVPVERIEGPIRRRAIPIVLAVVLFVAVAGLGATLLWRQQQVRFLEARRKSELEKEVLASHYNYLRRSALDSILLVDEQGLILETNDRSLEMYGFSREELLGRHIAELRSPEGRHQFEEQWALVRSSPSALFETMHQRKDGTTFAVETNVRPIVVDGKTYFQAIVRDITQRDLERKQLESANRLYAVLSGTNQAIAKAGTEQEVFDSVCRVAIQEGGFQSVTIGMLDESGTWLTPVAWGGANQDPRPIRIAADSESVEEHPIARAFQSGQVAVVDNIATDPNPTPWHERARSLGLGSMVCVPLSRQGRQVGVLAIAKAEPYFSAASEVSLAEEIGADISHALGRLEEERKRKEAEEALRVSERRYRQLVESLPVGIMVHSDLRILYMSPAGLRMLRAASLDDVVGRPTLSMVHPDYHEIVRQRALLGPDAPAPAIEERFVRLDGTAFDVEVSAVPFELDGVKARLVFFLDITQRKKAEEERARIEQQFLQAQKMESVGRLAGGVAHDFNNHLTVINGYCEMLTSSLAETDPLRAEILSIQKAGQQAAELVRQLLAFSRKRVAEPRLVNLNHQVMESQRMLERLIGEHIEFVTSLAPRLGDVLADPTQIQQILMNLVVNARDAMSAGGRLTIETRHVRVDAEQAAHNIGARPGEFVCLTVSDTGAGMNAETLRHLFEPFFTTKPQAVGTGLGLSTVYGIVRQSNGWIEVESAPGAGATFRIYLPRVVGGGEPQPDAKPSSGATHGRETVLLVEDQPQVRELTASILKGLGYSVLEAPGGSEALAVAAGHPGAIDILVSDVVMPGMSGPQLAKQLRAVRPSVKVLYVSGYVTVEQAGEVLAGDNVHQLSKPFTPAALAAKVREALST